MTKAPQESGHTSSHFEHTLSQAAGSKYTYPDMNIQRRGMTTPYIDRLGLTAITTEGGLNPEPRIKVVGDHICRVATSMLGFDVARQKLEQATELLSGEIDYVATSSLLITGRRNLFIGLVADKKTKETLTTERDTALDGMDLSVDDILERQSRKANNLIVGRFTYHERKNAAEIAGALNESLRAEPLPIKLGSAILSVQEI